jgi:predicted DsbA family dithiol-disulfide isomerase
LAEFPLQEAIEGKPVTIDYRPFELRPYPTPTLNADSESRQRRWTSSIYPLAERLQVSIKLPTVSPPPYTRLAFEGMQFAREHGKAGEYNLEVFRAFFQRSEDIGNIPVLAQIAAEVGLPEKKFTAALESGTYSAKNRALVQQGREVVKVVPTFFIARRRLEGVQPAEKLVAIIEEESRLSQ